MTTKNNDTDFDIASKVMARRWKSKPFATPITALEVISGEYKGVVFFFKKFHIADKKTKDGMQKVAFETEIVQVPDTLPTGWTPDVAFDEFASEVAFKWLSFVNQNDLAPLIHAKTDGKIH